MSFLFRTGFGNLHILPSGEVVVSAHGIPPGSTTLRPVVGKDVHPGAGVFPEICEGPENYLWPPISVTNNGWIHCAMIEGTTQDDLYYSKIREWCRWTNPIPIASEIGGPSHNITSSLNSNRVLLMWTWPERPIYTAF